MHVLAEIVDQRRAVIEHRIARIGFRQADLANFQRGCVRGITHGDAERADMAHRRVTAGLDVDPVAVARLVHRRRQLVRIPQALAKEAQRNGGAHPDIREGMNPLRDVALIADESELESLAGGRAEFDHQEFGVGPVGRQLRIDVRQRPLRGRDVAREGGLLWSSVSANEKDGPREQARSATGRVSSPPPETGRSLCEALLAVCRTRSYVQRDRFPIARRLVRNKFCVTHRRHERRRAAFLVGASANLRKIFFAAAGTQLDAARATRE